MTLVCIMSSAVVGLEPPHVTTEKQWGNIQYNIIVAFAVFKYLTRQIMY